jgi:hypothetical protein
MTNNVFRNLIHGGASFIEKQGDRILYSRFVLYFIIFITFFNLVGHSLYGDLMTPLIFILVAYITSCFSKNMIVVLSMGLAVSNVFKYGSRSMRIEEGMENETDEGEPESVDKSEKRIDTPKSDTKATKVDVKARKKDVDYIHKKYQDLLKLHDKVVDNVGSLEKTMKEMDTLIVDVKENVETMQNRVETMKDTK